MHIQALHVPKGSLMCPFRPFLVLSSTGLNHRTSSETKKYDPVSISTSQNLRGTRGTKVIENVTENV